MEALSAQLDGLTRTIKFLYMSAWFGGGVLCGCVFGLLFASHNSKPVSLLAIHNNGVRSCHYWGYAILCGGMQSMRLCILYARTGNEA